MAWLVWFILVFVILAESVRNRLKTPEMIMAVAILFISPIVWSLSLPLHKAVWLAGAALVWMGYRLAKKAKYRYILLMLYVILSGFLTANFNGVVGWDLEINRERLVMADGKFAQVLSRTREEALYMPYRLRPLVSEIWITPLFLTGQTLEWMWPDKLIGLAGITGVILAGYTLIKRRDITTFLIMAGITAGGAISRNPDATSIYLVLAPIIYSLVTESMVLVSKHRVSILIGIGILFLITA